MIERLLKTWHKQIPAMSCESGCRECCEGDARAMTLSEWRPLICRLFGAVAPDDPALVELAGTFPIACPRGCAPEVALPLAAALQIQVAYQNYANRELQKVIEDWHQFMGLLHCLDITEKSQSEPLPEKFQWLRYVLSTREGQTTLRLLWGATPVNIDPARMEQMAAMMGD
jgi:hypothetical protein